MSWKMRKKKPGPGWLMPKEKTKKPSRRCVRIAEGEESTGDEPEDIPAREMLADLLLEAKHPEQALAEYEADLKFNPNRFNGLYGAASAAEMAGKNEKAADYYAQLVKNCAGSKFRSAGAGRKQRR